MGAPLDSHGSPTPQDLGSMGCHSFHHQPPPRLQALVAVPSANGTRIASRRANWCRTLMSKIPVDKKLPKCKFFPAIPAITIGLKSKHNIFPQTSPWPNHLCSGGEHVSQSVKPIASTSLGYFKAPSLKKIHGQIVNNPFL